MHEVHLNVSFASLTYYCEYYCVFVCTCTFILVLLKNVYILDGGVFFLLKSTQD